MGSCRMRIVLARIAGLPPETVDVLSECMGPECALVLRATDIFGGRMILGMRVTDNGLETMVESDDAEPTGDPMDVFREFVTDDCSMDVLLYLPDGQQPPICAFPADAETVPGKRAYRIIPSDAEMYRWLTTNALGAGPPTSGVHPPVRAGSVSPSWRMA